MNCHTMSYKKVMQEKKVINPEKQLFIYINKYLFVEILHDCFFSFSHLYDKRRFKGIFYEIFLALHVGGYSF